MNILYDASHTHGHTEVVGTITTDGFLGYWTEDHILDFDLVLTGERPGHMTLPEGHVLYVSGLRSTETELLLQTREWSHLVLSGDGTSIGFGADYQCLTCFVVVAHDGMPVPMPDPSTAWLVGLGMILLAFTRRRT